MPTRSMMRKVSKAVAVLAATVIVGACGGSPQARSITLTFIRHAQSEANASGVIATAVPAAYDERLAWLRQAAGARFDELELQCLTFAVQVVPDGPAVLERLAALFGMSVDDVAGSPVALIGSVDGIVETLEERRRRWGFSYVVVHEAELDAFAPVVARLAGS